MHYAHKWTTISVLALAVSSPAFAAQGQMQGAVKQMMAAGTGKDHMLKPSDIKNDFVKENFAKIDTNHDGLISEAELTAFFTQQMSAHTAGGGGGGGARPGGGMGGFSPPKPGTILPSFLADQLSLTPDQKKQMDALQKEVDGGISKILTDSQKKQMANPPAMGMMGGGGRPGGMPGGMGGPGGPPGGMGGPGGPPGGAPRPRMLIPGFMQDQLKLSSDQKSKLDALQKTADAKRDKILTDAQKKKLAEVRSRGFGGMGGGRPGGMPGGMMGGRPGGPPGKK